MKVIEQRIEEMRRMEAEEMRSKKNEAKERFLEAKLGKRKKGKKGKKGKGKGKKKWRFKNITHKKPKLNLLGVHYFITQKINAFHSQLSKETFAG